MRVLAATGGLQAVNLVSLESYLLGVVASEMPSSWKPEALEAQAIAARTYAVATRKAATSPYDLFPDERSQVYRGLAAESRDVLGRGRGDRRAGRALPGPADRDVLLVFDRRPQRECRGGHRERRSTALPRRRRRSLRHDLALPRLDALAERPRPLAEGDLPGPRDRPAGRRVPLRPRAHADAERQRRARSTLSAALVRKRLGLRSTWFTRDARRLPSPTTDATIALHARVVHNRVLLTGAAPPGTSTLQGAARAGWRDLATHAVGDDGAVAFRRPLGEASRYRLVAGSLATPRRCRSIRRSGLLLRGRPGARLHGRLFPARRARRRRAPARRRRALEVDRERDGRAPTAASASPLRASGGRWRVRWRGAGSFLGSLSPELRVGARTLAWTPTDPLAAREWNLAAVNAFGYADVLPGAAGLPVTVAVIDSGIDRTSPDLVRRACRSRPIDEAHDPTTSLVHGTAVAGIIAADANNGIGGRRLGAPYVQLLDYRVVSGGRRRSRRSRPAAIRDAVGAGARVINLSLGGKRDPKHPELDEFSRAERDAISYASNAARSSSPPSATPAGHRRLRELARRAAATCSASRPSTQKLAWAPFSNTDPVFNDIAAPGRRHHHDRAARARAAPARRSTRRPATIVGADGTVLGHLVRGAARERRRGRPAGRATPSSRPTQVMWILEHTRATACGDAGARRARPLHGLRPARRHGRGQARRRAARRAAAGRRRRAQRRAVRGQVARDLDGHHRRDRRLRRRPPRRLQDLRARGRDAARAHGGAPARAATSALDVAHLPARHDEHRELAQGRARSTRSASAAARCSARNSTRQDGYFLVQVSSRRGWGAYRLRWIVCRLGL